MTIAEILPQLQHLSDADKMRLIEILSKELPHNGVLATSMPSEPVPIWSPHDSYEAADVLFDFARDQKALS